MHRRDLTPLTVAPRFVGEDLQNYASRIINCSYINPYICITPLYRYASLINYALYLNKFYFIFTVFKNSRPRNLPQKMQLDSSIELIFILLFSRNSVKTLAIFNVEEKHPRRIT